MTVASVPAAELHRRLHDAFVLRDRESLGELLAAGASWRIGGKSRLAGQMHGRDVVLDQLYMQLRTLSGGTARLERGEYWGDNDTSVGWFQLAATRNGILDEFDICEVVSWRSGQAHEARWFFADQYAWDALWS